MSFCGDYRTRAPLEAQGQRGKLRIANCEMQIANWKSGGLVSLREEQISLPGFFFNLQFAIRNSQFAISLLACVFSLHAITDRNISGAAE